jgi:Na+/melibiose symporter-like transporter
MAAEAALESGPSGARRVGWGFISLYTLAYMSTSLLFLAPVLVTLALKVNSLVGIKQAPSSLALVAGIGALVALIGNPFFGWMSDRTTSRLGMRRPWMVAGLAGGSVAADPQWRCRDSPGRRRRSAGAGRRGFSRGGKRRERGAA